MEPSGRSRRQPVANASPRKPAKEADRQLVATHGNGSGARCSVMHPDGFVYCARSANGNDAGTTMSARSWGLSWVRWRYCAGR